MVKCFKHPIEWEKKLQLVPKPKVKIWDISMGLICVLKGLKGNTISTHLYICDTRNLRFSIVSEISSYSLCVDTHINVSCTNMWDWKEATQVGFKGSLVSQSDKILCHVSNFEIGPSFLVEVVRVQLRSYIKIWGFANTLSWINVENGQFYPLKRGTNLETKLLKVRHMSSTKVFYLGLSNSISKLVFLNMCSPLYKSNPSILYLGLVRISI